MEVYYERLEMDDEIDREAVANERDVATLKEWGERLRVIEGELHTMIASMREAGEGAAASGMARKLGYVRIAKGWISERLLALGEEIPAGYMGSKFKRLKFNLTCANQQLEKRKKEAKRLREHIDRLERQMKDAGIWAGENA